MKSRLLLPFLLLSLTGPARAVDAPAAPGAAAAKAEDLSTYKTADALWTHLQELQKEPDAQPKTREEMTALIGAWFGRQRAAAEAFVTMYPADPRRWAARMIRVQSALQLAQLPGADAAAAATKADAVLGELAEIAGAPDAPAEVKAEATFAQAMMLTEHLDESKPETVAAFLKAADAFLAKFGADKFAAEMRLTQVRVATQFPTPEAVAILQKYAAEKDEALAAPAKEGLARFQRMQALKSKPLDLKFTAVDGHEVDLAALRGKVVLVDFWASWCGPCRAEMPNVVAAYGKLHDKGFEILGISLDQDKAAMEGALKTLGMKWPQYFDGQGWKNKISSAFGIESIPAAWLLDKKGMLRATSLRGEALAAGVERLLAE